MPAEWAANGWDGDNDWEFSSAADDSPEELYARYDAAVDRARTRLAARVADAAASTSRWRSPRSWGQEVSLRRIVCDLVEEYGRHTGQADLIREAVDGRVGEDPPPGWRPGS